MSFSGWNSRFDRWELGSALSPREADRHDDVRDEETLAGGVGDGHGGVGPALPPKDDVLLQVRW